MRERNLNPIVGKEYNNLMRTMIQAAEFDQLPVCMEVSYPSSITLDDCKELAQWMLEDTGLDVSFQAYLCDNCGEMHLLMVIDYQNDEEE